jgi:hypothetical protein
MRLAPGTRLGPYQILAPLGAGGMGEVYRARDSRLGRDVAVKTLPERLSNDPQALARFMREIRVVAALSHPNLLSIFDTGTEAGASYAVIATGRRPCAPGCGAARWRGRRRRKSARRWLTAWPPLIPRESPTAT